MGEELSVFTLISNLQFQMSFNPPPHCSSALLPAFSDLFARQLGEPPVNTAIAFEAYVEYTVHNEQPEVELVSRSLQSSGRADGRASMASG